MLKKQINNATLGNKILIVILFIWDLVCGYESKTKLLVFINGAGNTIANRFKRSQGLT
jgi:hypothetical protein